MIIDLIDLDTQLINVYNAIHPNILNSIPTIQRDNLLPATLASNTIILGDFNTHHPWWDPLRPHSQNSVYLMDIIERYSLNLLNTPGDGTFYRPYIAFPSVIDLGFATNSVLNQVQDWQVIPDLGSDYFGVCFTIRDKLERSSNTSPSMLRFNTKKADWNLFRKELTSNISLLSINPGATSKLDLDALASRFTNSILDAANISIPKTSNTAYSKPWWNKRLAALRKEYTYFCRRAKESKYTLFKEESLNAKNTYFNTIKVEKTKH